MQQRQPYKKLNLFLHACTHSWKNTLSHLYIHQANKCIQISSSSIDISSSLSLNKNDKVNPVLYVKFSTKGHFYFSGKSGKRPWTAIFVYITKFHAYLDFVCRCHTKIVNLKLFILQIVYYNTLITEKPLALFLPRKKCKL